MMEYKDFKDDDWGRMLANLPKGFRDRQFKFFLEDKTVIKLKAKSIFSLQNKLLRFEPVAVYLSVFRALNPSKVKAKIRNFKGAGYKMATNLFYGADLVIEIDSKNKDNLNKVLFLLERDFGFTEFNVFETGRGYHVWIREFYNDCNSFCRENTKIQLPQDREEFNSKWRIAIATHLVNQKCNIDYDTTIDTRRVLRLPYSIYKKKQLICLLNHENKKLGSEQSLTGV